MWPGAPRSMPDGSFLARAASALSVRPHVASRLSILCSTNCSTNSPSGVCRRHDRFEPSPFSRSRRRKGRGEARGAGAGHSRRGCVPASPVVGVRRKPPARVPFGPPLLLVLLAEVRPRLGMGRDVMAKKKRRASRVGGSFFHRSDWRHRRTHALARAARGRPSSSAARSRTRRSSRGTRRGRRTSTATARDATSSSRQRS